MKALVLSGGSGTRLRPFSYSMPKQLIPIANKPVLEHVLENIRDLGVTEIGVIVGDWAPQIQAVLGDGSRLGVRITYIPQDRPTGLAACVSLARPFLGDDDFVMYLGDNMLPEGVGRIAEQFTATRPAAQVVVHKVSDPRAFGVAELDADGRVERLVEKPQNPRSDLALIGVYFFTPAIHEAVASIEPSTRGELEITDAVQWLVTHGAEVKASEYGGYWKDTGRVEDVLECNRKLLDGLKPRIDGEVDPASVLIGPVVVEAGARVIRSRIEGPVIIGAGTVVEDSHIGPHTSIGKECVLSGTHIDYSIALDGAMVSQVRGLYGSLIGRSASVGPADIGTTHHRLVVGDHTRVEVAA
ncbi:MULTISPECIES: glucose-1-phosphate thymidylyltransferase [unclassified Streptomyces]|uniref:glucose-1-phosphate thymidylyltransferase n=1 Tax=unclassified Streptomyces TaxID=2593676 RepID=UPI002F90ACA3